MQMQAKGSKALDDDAPRLDARAAPAQEAKASKARLGAKAREAPRLTVLAALERGLVGLVADSDATGHLFRSFTGRLVR